MKLKKQFKIFVCFLFVTTFAATFYSCQKDTQNNPATSTADRDKFLGSWVSQSSGAVHGSLSFTMSITAGNSSASQIRMENFDGEGPGTFVFADISGNSISISRNIVNGDTIQGTGTYNSNNTLGFNYSFRDGQTVDNRTATAHK